MANIVVIGSGVAGLTAAAYLGMKGHRVRVFEQFDRIGGVTATFEKEGYHWDLGPMLLQGFGPGEPGGIILDELGVSNRLTLIQDDRGVVFPDFDLWKPPDYQGPYWRRERLKEIFPREADGLDRYYRFYDQMMDLICLAHRAETAGPVAALGLKAWAWALFQRVKPYREWSAERLMNHFFHGDELKGLFTGILADFVVRPSLFSALAIPAVNIETAFDKRVPRKVSAAGVRPSYYYVAGGCRNLVRALADKVLSCGGQITAKSPVERIQTRQGRVEGVVLADGRQVPADLVVASGGVREIMFDVVGREHLTPDFAQRVDDVPLMESVHMVHLGVDYDTKARQPGPLCYYYGTYDVEGAVRRCQNGKYHEGKDGFLIYVPSRHSADMAPAGREAVTIYTIAPNRLDRGTWAERGEEFTDRLLEEAERIMPGLRSRIEVMEIMTPEDFCRRTHLKHHAFGGRAPVMGKSGGPHRTPIKGLWFVGSQSEKVGGGVSGTMAASKKVIQMIEKDAP